MSDGNKSSLRIDWFDGTLIEACSSRSNVTSEFDEEDPLQQVREAKPQYVEKKPIGFNRLLQISLLKGSALTSEVSYRPGFWMLLDKELKGDFIVLIVKILANVYKSLDPCEESRITTLLKTKFEKSKFLNTLKEYLSNLPHTRIVEKRMNSQFWDDAESFFFDVIYLCEGIINHDQHNIELLIDTHSLLKVTESSVVGVREEHTERFADDLFIRLHKLQSKIGKLINMNAEETISQLSNIANEVPNSFRRLSIFPSRDDLLGNNAVSIQPNIVNGAYPSVEHYLDLQFKLLREDCFGALRDGLSNYIKNPSKRRYENIRVHPKVRIIRIFVSNNKVGHLVDIAWKDRNSASQIDTKKFKYNKQLMYGSLLLFTNDNFENILCATVLDSNSNLLSDGYIAVSFQNPVSKTIIMEQYLMVESEVFFEPYHRVLKVLQSFKESYMPMRKYIVDVQNKTQPPSYLDSDTIVYSIIDNKTSEEFNVLNLDSWPESKSFGLDDSQMEAYKLALTREFAVIQGPPGTGKTFIGVKIASTLLMNLSLEGTPMLIICYTNHALDQFLEGVLNVTQNIVRLGSQSKSKLLESYTLSNLRNKVKSKYSHFYAKKRSELENIFKEMTEIQTEIEKCEKEILSYKSIKGVLKFNDELYELKNYDEDPVLSWLFDDFDTAKETGVDDSDDWEKQFDYVNVGDNKIETCFSEQWALNEIDSMMNSIKYVKDITEDHMEAQTMINKFKNAITKLHKRITCFKQQIYWAQSEITEIPVGKISNLYNLTTEQRWKIYFKCVGSIKRELIVKLDGLMEQHATCSGELDEVSTLVDCDVMSTARVVGVTTTAAARRHDLMRKLNSTIVIVEEAAEVLEAHIVASLTHHCQHLILIGDHKQLKPTAAHYKLAKHYNLEISLFERMIRNGIHARTLTTQRRMRPNFVELLVPTIYDKLDSHPTVYEYHDVRGLADNLYFCTHEVSEDSEGLEDSWSHKNVLEAKWCVALAEYLRLKDYKSNEITLLSTYTGQVALIKELSKNYPNLRDVKITAVDSYQGEENRIIILSLVRSNKDLKIGFLAAANRICVALSRAKEGFYMFGNMKVLKSASNIWRCINEKLVAQTAIGDKITLRCDRHKENTLDIYSPEDFGDALSGSCLKICKKK